MSFPDAAAVFIDEFAHRHPQVGFDDAGLIVVAHHLENLGALGVLGALGLVPFGAVDHYGRHGGQGLDVVDDGRLAPHAHDAGERRLDPGVAPFAFDGLDERGFFAAHIRAAAGLHLDVEAEAGALMLSPKRFLASAASMALLRRYMLR